MASLSVTAAHPETPEHGFTARLLLVAGIVCSQSNRCTGEAGSKLYLRVIVLPVLPEARLVITTRAGTAFPSLYLEVTPFRLPAQALETFWNPWMVEGS